MGYKEILGAIATAIAFVGYVPYVKDMIAGRTKPHAFSWFVWGSLTAIGFFGQIADNAGPGAWVTGFSAAVCTMIFVFALYKGEKHIVLIDWLCLIGAGIALWLWFVTDSPLLSVIIITIIDALGFIPTFRKSYEKPFEETMSTYILSGTKFVIAMFALTNVTIITTLYPLSLVLMNFLFVAMLVVRRRQR